MRNSAFTGMARTAGRLVSAGRRLLAVADALPAAFLVAVSMIERRAARRPRLIAGQDGEAGEASWPAAAEHQGQHGQPITRDALRARLGVSNQAASELLRQLRADQGLPPGTACAA